MSIFHEPVVYKVLQSCSRLQQISPEALDHLNSDNHYVSETLIQKLVKVLDHNALLQQLLNGSTKINPFHRVYITCELVRLGMRSITTFDTVPVQFLVRLLEEKYPSQPIQTCVSDLLYSNNRAIHRYFKVLALYVFHLPDSQLLPVFLIHYSRMLSECDFSCEVAEFLFDIYRIGQSPATLELSRILARHLNKLGRESRTVFIQRTLRLYSECKLYKSSLEYIPWAQLNLETSHCIHLLHQIAHLLLDFPTDLKLLDILVEIVNDHESVLTKSRGIVLVLVYCIKFETVQSNESLCSKLYSIIAILLKQASEAKGNEDGSIFGLSDLVLSGDNTALSELLLHKQYHMSILFFLIHVLQYLPSKEFQLEIVRDCLLELAKKGDAFVLAAIVGIFESFLQNKNPKCQIIGLQAIPKLIKINPRLQQRLLKYLQTGLSIVKRGNGNYCVNFAIVQAAFSLSHLLFPLLVELVPFVVSNASSAPLAVFVMDAINECLNSNLSSPRAIWKVAYSNLNLDILHPLVQVKLDDFYMIAGACKEASDSDTEFKTEIYPKLLSRFDLNGAGKISGHLLQAIGAFPKDHFNIAPALIVVPLLFKRCSKVEYNPLIVSFIEQEVKSMGRSVYKTDVESSLYAHKVQEMMFELIEYRQKHDFGQFKTIFSLTRLALPVGNSLDWLEALAKDLDIMNNPCFLKYKPEIFKLGMLQVLACMPHTTVLRAFNEILDMLLRKINGTIIPLEKSNLAHMITGLVNALNMISVSVPDDRVQQLVGLYIENDFFEQLVEFHVLVTHGDSLESVVSGIMTSGKYHLLARLLPFVIELRMDDVVDSIIEKLVMLFDQDSEGLSDLSVYLQDVFCNYHHFESVRNFAVSLLSRTNCSETQKEIQLFILYYSEQWLVFVKEFNLKAVKHALCDEPVNSMGNWLNTNDFSSVSKLLAFPEFLQVAAFIDLDSLNGYQLIGAVYSMIFSQDLKTMELAVFYFCLLSRKYLDNSNIPSPKHMIGSFEVNQLLLKNGSVTWHTKTDPPHYRKLPEDSYLRALHNFSLEQAPQSLFETLSELKCILPPVQWLHLHEPVVNEAKASGGSFKFEKWFSFVCSQVKDPKSANCFTYCFSNAVEYYLNLDSPNWVSNTIAILIKSEHLQYSRNRFLPKIYNYCLEYDCFYMFYDSVIAESSLNDTVLRHVVAISCKALKSDLVIDDQLYLQAKLIVECISRFSDYDNCLLGVAEIESLSKEALLVVHLNSFNLKPKLLALVFRMQHNSSEDHINSLCYSHFLLECSNCQSALYEFVYEGISTMQCSLSSKSLITALFDTAILAALNVLKQESSVESLERLLRDLIPRFLSIVLSIDQSLACEHLQKSEYLNAKIASRLYKLLELIEKGNIKLEPPIWRKYLELTLASNGPKLEIINALNKIL